MSLIQWLDDVKILTLSEWRNWQKNKPFHQYEKFSIFEFLMFFFQLKACDLLTKHFGDDYRKTVKTINLKDFDDVFIDD